MNSDSGMTSDQTLAEAVEQALQSNEATARHPLSVAAVGSTITLSGHVDSQEAKDEAIRIARSVDGVVDVTDDVRVGGDGDRGIFGGLFGGDRVSDTGNDNDGGTHDTAVPAAGVGLFGAAGMGARGGGAGTGTATGLGLGAAAPLAAGELADDTVDNAGGDYDNTTRNDRETTSMDNWEG